MFCSKSVFRVNHVVAISLNYSKTQSRLFHHLKRGTRLAGRPLAKQQVPNSIVLGRRNLCAAPQLKLTMAARGRSKDKIDSPRGNRQKKKSAQEMAVLERIVKDQCGEDAYFFSNIDKHNSDYLGVADGVGGWQDMGVNPALFSWSLMNNCREIIEKDNKSDIPLPVDVLHEAHKRVMASDDVTAGSSTACIAVFDRSTNVLNVANLGDSGLVVIRDSKIIFRTKEQQHFFNAPFQLAVIPEKLRGTSIVDKAQDSQIDSLHLQENDFILLATDGLFDNMFDYDIEQCYVDHAENDCSSIANYFLEKAVEYALDSKRASPFAQSARRFGYRMLGGKVDDVCVVVGVVKSI